MDKKSILVYHDWLTDYEDLTDQEFGELIRALLKYDINGEESKFNDKTMNFAYKQAKRIVSNNRKSYEDKCKKLSNNANASKCKQMDANATNCMQMQANGGDKVKVKVKVKDKVKDKDSVCAKEHETRTHAYQLSNQILYQDEVDSLVEKYGSGLVEETIKRIIEKPYYSCLDVEHISQWCEETKKNANKNVKAGFQQRTDTDYKELERRLFNK